MTAPMLKRYLSGRGRAVVLLGGALVAAILALVIVGVALFVKGRHATEYGRLAAASTSEDWIASVCKPGTYQNGKGGNVLSGSTGSAQCYGNAGGTIFVGTYDSEFRFNNAMARFPSNSRYATRSDNSGRLWVFVSPNGYTDLQPLASFGFAVH